jgi:TetR/AcrR family transcriptional regulator, cholesterol catabolism regulator
MTSNHPPSAPPSNGLERRRQKAAHERSSQYLERRQHLINVAVSVFHDKGFSDTTFTDIAKAADTDRANIYYYFESKAELFRDAVVELFFRDVAAVEEIAAGDASPPEKVRQIMVAIMANYGRHITYVLVRETEERWPKLSPAGYDDSMPEISDAGERFFTTLRAVIDAGLRDGSFQSRLSAGVLAQSVIGLVTWTNRWYEPKPGRYSSSELANATADLLLSGLTVPSVLNASMNDS